MTRIRLDKRPWAYTVVEDCLMIGCYKRLMKREGASLLSSLAQTLFGNNVITVNFRDGLREPMCEPIFLKQFREETYLTSYLIEHLCLLF